MLKVKAHPATDLSRTEFHDRAFHPTTSAFAMQQNPRTEWVKAETALVAPATARHKLWLSHAPTSFGKGRQIRYGANKSRIRDGTPHHPVLPQDQIDTKDQNLNRMVW